MSNEDELREAYATNAALVKGLAAVVIVAGGEVEVPDAVVATLGDDDEVLVTRNEDRDSHTVKVKSRKVVS